MSCLGPPLAGKFHQHDDAAAEREQSAWLGNSRAIEGRSTFRVAVLQRIVHTDVVPIPIRRNRQRIAIVYRATCRSLWDIGRRRRIAAVIVFPVGIVVVVFTGVKAIAVTWVVVGDVAVNWPLARWRIRRLMRLLWRIIVARAVAGVFNGSWSRPHAGAAT